MGHVFQTHSSPETPFTLVVKCMLWSIKENEPPERIDSDELVGLSVATGDLLNDASGILGCFMLFTDLSIRSPGAYRLQFILMEMR